MTKMRGTPKIDQGQIVVVYEVHLTWETPRGHIVHDGGHAHINICTWHKCIVISSIVNTTSTDKCSFYTFLTLLLHVPAFVSVQCIHSLVV